MSQIAENFALDNRQDQENPSKFDVAVGEVRESGFILARMHAMQLAVQDDRLERTALRVLVALMQHMNHLTLTTWIGRQKLAEQLGVSEKRISNCLSDLRATGYIVSERRPTSEAGGRVFQHHALAVLDPAKIEAELHVAAAGIEAHLAAETSRPAGNNTARHTGNRDTTSRHTGNETSRPTGNRNQSKYNQDINTPHTLSLNDRDMDDPAVEFAAWLCAGNLVAQANPDRQIEDARRTLNGFARNYSRQAVEDALAEMRQKVQRREIIRNHVSLLRTITARIHAKPAPVAASPFKGIL
jgi:predicted transcriptional regulator